MSSVPTNSCSSSCTLEVKATQIGDLFGFKYYHLYLVFTDQDGEQYYFRGGPGKKAGSSRSTGELSGGSSRSATVGSSEASTSGHSGSGSNPSSASDGGGGPYGTIQTEYGKYEPGTTDYDLEAKSTEVASGPDACKFKQQLETQMKLIQDSNMRYSPLGPNSNSTVFTALRDIGIKPKVPDGVWAPGANTPIAVPSIGGTAPVGSTCTGCQK